MTITLKSLILNNFKGIRSLTINFFGDTNIFGANEAGKSTIYTAFCWALTGKDEFDRKDFEIKNTRLKELNILPHEVELILDVDGREVKLKRVYLEKWVKPKGQSQKVFDGHTTEFFYNDVPCNLSEYQAKVDALIDPKVIKLITNPGYFNALKPEDQRRGLLTIAGEITNSDIIDSIATPDNDYSNLILVLNSNKYNDISEYKKELAAKKLLLKKKAAEYQPRIDELKRSLPEAKDWTELEAEQAKVKEQITNLDNLISDVSKATAERQKNIVARQNTIHSKKTEVNNIRFKIESELREKQNTGAAKLNSLRQQITECQNSIDRLKKLIDGGTSNVTAYQEQIDLKEAAVARLRTEWDVINAEKFEFDDSKCECPTCKQRLPEHDIETKKADMLKSFNVSVAERKANKVKLSNILKEEIKQLKESIALIETGRDANSDQLATEENKLTSLKFELSELQAKETPASVPNLDVAIDALMKNNADALNLWEEIAEIEAEINAESETMGTDASTNNYKEQRTQHQLRLDEINSQLGSKSLIEKTNERIKDLENEERLNAQEIADIEQKEFEIESFTRAKMDILQTRVNSKFKYVQFRLFEVQVNGGIAETCVCEYKGVPYPTLNTAAKLLAGLDVLNTFSKHLNVYAPVFCDNRESVSWIPESRSQIISLYVSPQDTSLRIEEAVNAKGLAVA